LPFFDGSGPANPAPVSPNAVSETSSAPVQNAPEPVEKTNTVRVVRKLGGSLTPSIKDALAGKVVEKTIVEEIGKAAYSEYDSYYEPFSKEQFELKWREFLDMISDRPNLIATLSAIPEISDGNKLMLKIGNSVQEEEVRLVKPELLAFLKRELRNSGIELNTSIERVESERTHYSDSEKLQALMQKNPQLFELKQKFNLDFNA
jgi:hypothetical protein